MLSFSIDKFIAIVYNTNRMKVAKFETQTSVYELTKEGNIYILRKKKIKRGKTSSVQAGEESRGDKVVFTRTCTLFMGDKPVIQTSVITKFP